jgi:peptide/nickel transport system permease protein
MSQNVSLPDQPADRARLRQASTAQTQYQSVSAFRRAWRRFVANRMALIALIVLVVMIMLAVCAPLISKYITKASPTDQQLLHNFEPISPKHWLGTDEYGRDVLTRIVYGGQVSMSVAALGVLVALAVGTLIGLVAAYYGGWVDELLMRFVDLMLSIPGIFLLILIGSLVQVGPAVLALIIALLSWFGLARLVRAETLSIKRREYVEAAHALGIGDVEIIIRHILPNILHIIIVWATVAVPNFILIEAVLSFLGLGVQPPTPSWGNMLTNATQYFYKSVGLVFIPGFFITITVLAFSIIGDALRDAFDPRLNN